MKRRLQVLGLRFASVAFVAFASMLGGCVAPVAESDDAVVADPGQGQARAALVGTPSGDPSRSSGSDPGGTGSVAKPGAPGMSDPQPQPWKPPPSGPPADPGSPGPESHH